MLKHYVTSFLALTLLASASSASSPVSEPSRLKKSSFTQFVHARTAAILDTLQSDNDYPAALIALQKLFDQAVLYSPNETMEVIREADFPLQLVTQLSNVAKPLQQTMLPYLRQHEELARTLVFLMRSDEEKPGNVYRTLLHLDQARGSQVDQYISLAVALCVVHDTPLTRSMNENHVHAADVVDLFDFYVKNQERMYFGIKNVPADLLVYVVDSTASIADMQWALDRYAGCRDVGSLFFTIDYDYAYLKRGTDKKVTVAGYSLPHILKFGGVCIDQAYFATSVGKAIGVPTAIDYGASAEAGHAWAGFLQYTGGNAGWNFNSGRYPEFQGVRGSVQNPQTRKTMPDSYVGLLGEMVGTRALDRQTAVALTDAARRMFEISKVTALHVAPPVSEVTSGTLEVRPRSTDVGSQLKTIELALKQSLACMPAWFTVRDLGVAGQMSEAQKREWSDILLRLGAKKYADFTLEMLMPMVQTMGDPQEEDRLLGKMLPMFATRFDLSTAILLMQARLRESMNQPDKAGECYMQVIEKYTNGGPFVLRALEGAEKLLKNANHPEQILLIYKQAWTRTIKPAGMARQFLEQSNWYRIGKAYSKRLSDQGDSVSAAAVETQLTS